MSGTRAAGPLEAPVKGREAAPWPAVAAVTINFGQPDDTLACVRSLLATAYPGLRIVVVDNASSEPARERLRANLPQDVELILSNQNLGFSGGNNVGIRRALDGGAEYVLLINNDATLESHALHLLAEQAGSCPNLGIASGKILVADDSGPTAVIWSAGGRWSPLKATGYPSGIGEVDRGQFDRPGDTEYLAACLWFVPSAVFRSVGLLDEAFFLYAEDVDYCLNLRKAGYRLLYEPRAICYHKVSGSHWHDRDRASPVLNYYTNRNRIIIARKWLTPVQRAAFYVYFLASRALLAGVRWDGSYLAGIVDGLRGRKGPRERGTGNGEQGTGKGEGGR